VARLAQSFRFYLTNAFTRYVKVLSDYLQVFFGDTHFQSSLSVA
jgi:ABC-type microcin C transport system permease subunit YejB